MKTTRILLTLLLALAAPACLAGTAFTYQGNLTDSKGPATGSFDLRFSLYDAANGGSVVAEPVVLTSVGVTNGLFTVSLDFGGVFNGNDRWLQIWVRTNGAASFTALTPRQWLTAAPWATYAPNAGSAALATAVPAGAITTAMLADGSVTSAKLGSGLAPGSSADDGGAADYADLMAAGRGLRSTDPLPFSDLSLVVSNSGTASLSFRLNGATVGTVRGFSGREALSEIYEYVVEVALPTAQYDPEAVIGGQGLVVFSRHGRSTLFGGMVTGCTRAASGAQLLYTFRLQPALALLGLRSDYRLFQQQFTPALAAQIYEAGTGEPLDQALSGSYPQHELTTQFAETDLSFFQRLLEYEGIFYLFRLNQAQPRLVLGDSSSAYLGAAYTSLDYLGNYPDNPRPGQECLRAFQRATRETAKAANLDGYDFKVPRKNLLARSAAATGRGETFEFDARTTDSGDMQSLARLRMQSQRVERNLATGAGNAADLRPGFTFTVNDLSGAGVSGDYVVTAVRHAAYVRSTNGVASLYYGNQFEALPVATPFSPPRKTPRPVVPACTAVVTGTVGEEIWTDQHGRVKVLFQWDRYGAGDQTSSAWVRVATHWAGKGWGSVAVPRVGQEVLVEFVNGDPDQPVVTGSFYNGDNMPPYALPANATQSGIKTHSSKAGGFTDYNEFRFEDKKGSEQVFLKAQKNLDVVANNDTTFGIGHDLAWSVGNDLTLDVNHDLVVTSDDKILLSAAQGIGINGPSDAALALKVGGTVGASLYTGNAGGLTNLPAAGLTGALADARLSSNIPRLNTSQTFSGNNVFLGRMSIGTSLGSDMLTIHGTARIDDSDLFFRPNGDLNHGVGWYGSGKLFAQINLDGPVLYGCDGGGLGTACGSQYLALRWRNDGNVMIDPNSVNTGGLLPGLTFGSFSGEGISSKRTTGGNQFGLDFYTSSTNRLSITQTGRVGIGTNTPATALDVVGSIHATGGIRSGSEAGTEQPANYPSGSEGLVVRRASSTTTTAGSIVARTERIILERDGTLAGLRLSYAASPGRQTIHAIGITANGTQVIVRQMLNNPATTGAITLFTDAQRVTHYDVTFGNTYSLGHTVHVVLDRYDDGTTSDDYLVGTITTTYNQ